MLKIVLMLVIVSGNTVAQAPPFSEFKRNYDNLNIDLMNNPAETASVSNFVYHKDAATITLKNGTVWLLRYINDRPTTAVFVGEGSAKVTVPTHIERQHLLTISGDTLVDESFGFCFIRMADDFDVELRKVATFHPAQMDYETFSMIKQKQGEFYFRPTIMHEYDNYFQLLQSVYPRRADGFFWIDFERYNFMFDPNRPEQVVIGYERQGGALTASEAAVFKRLEEQLAVDSNHSSINYPCTILRQTGTINLSGMDGSRIDSANLTVHLLINRDSMTFLPLYLHNNLAVDHMAIEGTAVNFHRRNDFGFIGVMLPRVYQKGDTLLLDISYHGKNYAKSLPFVADPSAAHYELTFVVPEDYNYIMPGTSEPKELGKRMSILAAPAEPFRTFSFRAYAAGYDTVDYVSELGMPIHFVKSGAISKTRFENFVPDDMYERVVLEAFNYLTGRLGAPPGTYELFIFPDSNQESMPGLVEIPQVLEMRDGTGGLHEIAAFNLARQWFGSLARPATDREQWLIEGTADYLSLLTVKQLVGPGVFFGELGTRRGYLHTQLENNWDLPLAAGRRLSPELRIAKGTWLMHMLYTVMFDTEKRSELQFWKFLRELVQLTTSQTFTNADVQAVAEKYAAQDLDWFFHQWVYSRNFPVWSGNYEIVSQDEQYYVKAAVEVKNVNDDFVMPVLVRAQDASGKSTFARHQIRHGANVVMFGPFAAKPTDVVFNELYGVLAKGEIKRK